MKEYWRFLNPGDKVVCIKSSLGECYKAGNTYIIKEIKDRWLFTILDEKKSITNGWYVENFQPSYIKEFELKIENIINE